MSAHVRTDRQLRSHESTDAAPLKERRKSWASWKSSLMSRSVQVNLRV
jgi:hypothetical protein